MNVRLLLPILALAGLAVIPARAQEAGVEAGASLALPADGAWYSQRLILGTRVTGFILEDAHSGSFLGSINELDAEQDFAPYKVFADYFFLDWLGVELTWDTVAAQTTTAIDGHHDGSLEIAGPILTVVARWVSEYVWTPYAGVGVGLFSGDFTPETWWELAYSSKADWESLGSPHVPRNNRTRNFDVDDPVGLVLTAGTGLYLTEHWSMDFYVRYTDVEIDVDYTIQQKGAVIDDRGTSSVPLSNFAAGVGVAYWF
jgi:outer membrane protein W